MRSENNMAEVVSCSVQSGVDTTANNNIAIIQAATDQNIEMLKILIGEKK